MPPRGMEYWRRLDEVIQREPVDERANLAKTAIVHFEVHAGNACRDFGLVEAASLRCSR